MPCRGCQHGLPCLDLQLDISAVQSVGPHTSREEIRDLYHQVYKLRRLPKSPLCGLEWAGELTRDVVSSLKNCLSWKEDELPREWGGQNLLILTQSETEPHRREARLFGQN